MDVSDIGAFLLTTLVAGVLGATALELTMWLITRTGWAKGDMILAVGSLLTRNRDHARRVGVVAHIGSAVIFATAYTLLLMLLHMTTMPYAFILGLGLGFVHGMVVSLALVWVIAEHHPLEEFKEADLAIGLSHLAGHVAYGGVVGLVVGIAPV